MGDVANNLISLEIPGWCGPDFVYQDQVNRTTLYDCMIVLMSLKERKGINKPQECGFLLRKNRDWSKLEHNKK